MKYTLALVTKRLSLVRNCGRFAFALFFSLSVWQINAAEVTGVSHDDGLLTLQTSEGKVDIQALTSRSVSVWYQPEGVKQLPSFAVDPNLALDVSAKLVKVDTGWQFELPGLTVAIQAQPLKLSYWRDGEELVSEEVGLFHQETIRGFRFALDEDEQIMGGGQRVLGMDRRGHRLPLYNRAHYGYTTESSQMYYGLPAIMSSQRYAIIFDNSASGFLDIGHTESDVLQFEAVGGRTAYIVVAGEGFSDLVSHTVTATGKQPLPPRWALGNFASRFGYRTEQETRDTIDAFIEQDIPVDAVVLDLYWFGPDIKGHMGNLNWDRNAWPEPEKMIADLRAKGVKTVVITEPFILTSSSQWQSAVDNRALATNFAGEPRRFDFYFGNTGLVDVFAPQAQEWFWQYYEKLAEQGVAGWWGDLGEPEVHPGDSLHSLNDMTVTGDEVHNAYGHQWAKMVYERQLALAPEKRPFVMMRAGFAGTQRYGMIPWTGDVSREWGGLKPQVELALQMSLFGLAYTHSDLGGFAGGETFDAELYTRWLQFGTFSPVFRPHAQEHIAPEPVFHADPVKSTARDYIQLRYRLMPYIYSLAYENSMTGVPFMRPLFMHHSDAKLTNTDSYLFGESFLVTPITEKGQVQADVDLPAGTWFNFWTNDKVMGGETVTIPAPLEQLPVLVKAGSFVPMVDAVMSLDKYSTATLDMHYYADTSVANSQFTVYDDDGESANSLTDNQFEALSFTAQHTSTLQLSVARSGDFANRPQTRVINWNIHGLTEKPGTVKIGDTVYAIGSSENVHWNDATNTLEVKSSLHNQLVINVE
ncbi:glycoside hydrolase family 31 protein [Alteromonas sp. ASW11-36]|uniref:Glycoside hydrolase family 31 protein n=1 Tax=Alteromonas arenosi TaxID=3055817 RepID=A0ABT7SWZ9_9ALTE|nr:TIM-barrel domain-containing protein [Alteromonas sp. ASW11-36]MDM7860707.1 glycoside hydrolase family 31 protein [Alteromonas sp. ASW11-36]